LAKTGGRCRAQLMLFSERTWARKQRALGTTVTWRLAPTALSRTLKVRRNERVA
jgi:hypothetical protein